ncbi:hypothetical protein GCK32_021491, partial [Trichostrongylus colubriformis]
LRITYMEVFILTEVWMLQIVDQYSLINHSHQRPTTSSSLIPSHQARTLQIRAGRQFPTLAHLYWLHQPQ